LSLQPKRGIARLKVCPHGGINHAELMTYGLKPEDMIDFSVCTNPFMPPPGIKETLSQIPIEQYPDSEANDFREELSAHLGVPAGNILAGNGTTELIRLIAIAYFRQGDPVLILEPTYGEYEIAGRIADARLVRHQAREEDNLTPRIEDIIDLIRKHRPQGVFICNPNNPTGKYLSRRDMETVIDAGEDSLFILDEAYIAFVTKRWNSMELATRGNVVVLRSMTKDYGMPGLRLGYMVAHQDIIKNLRRVRPPWNVNIVAQTLGTAVLKNAAYLEQSLKQIQDVKRFLTDELCRRGFKVLPSDANYFLMKVGNAGKFRQSLLKYGIMVRDCTSFGLPEYVRIAPRTRPECERLIAAIDIKLKSGE
jgi:histidinol-phosphate aminotransferase